MSSALAQSSPPTEALVSNSHTPFILRFTATYSRS